MEFKYRANWRSPIEGNSDHEAQADPPEAPGTPQHRFKLPIGRFTIRGVKGALLVLVLEYLVLPQLAGARKSLHVLSNVNLAWLAAGVGLEFVALLAFAKLTESVLPKGQIKLWKIFRIDLSSLAFSHVIPAGAAGGTGVSMRQFTASGVRATDAGFAIAIQGIGSAVVLNIILWLALLVSIPLRGFNPLYALAAGLGVVVFAVFFALLILFTRGEEKVAHYLDFVCAKLKFLPRDRIFGIISRVGNRIAELEAHPDLLRKAVIYASLNWLADAASLWVFMAAFGYYVNPDALLVSYGLANVLAAIPITPGGLGVIEGVLTSTLVGFGSPRAIAILGVIGYRLINFWLPIPVGGLLYFGFRRHPPSPTRRSEIDSMLEIPNIEPGDGAVSETRFVQIAQKARRALRPTLGMQKRYDRT